MDLLRKDISRVEDKLRVSSAEDHELMAFHKEEHADTGYSAPVDTTKTDPLMASVVCGLVHGLIVTMSFASFAFMIFGDSEHKELKDAFALGISQQMLSAGVLIGVLTFTGFFPFTMGGPTPPAALLVADVVNQVMAKVEDSDKKVPTAMLTVMLVTLFLGILLILSSVTNTAAYAQQLPYPCLCGFLGSVGFLLMRAAMQTLLDAKLKWLFIPSSIYDFDSANFPVLMITVLLGFLVAGTLLWVVPAIKPRFKNKNLKVLVLPIMFLLPVVAFYIVAIANSEDFSPTGTLRTVQPSWLFPDVEVKPFWELWTTLYNPGKWDVMAVLECAHNILIASLLCGLAAMINMSGIEANAPQEHSLRLNTEFMSLGRACIGVAVLGGHPGHHVAAFTLPMKKDGGSRRAAPWTASILWLLAFFTGVPLSAYIPRFFLGGCFLQVGFGLARTFLWDNRKAFDWESMCIAWAMVLVALFTDLNIAAGAGLVFTAISFLQLSMNSQVVHSVHRVDQRRSLKYRNAAEADLLTFHGHKVMILTLQGQLFWGTVDEITEAFEKIIDGSEDAPDVIYVDLTWVTGLDLSVINAFKKLCRLAKNNDGITICLCNIPRAQQIGTEIRQMLCALPFVSEEPLRELIEKSEEKLLEKLLSRRKDPKNPKSKRKQYYSPNKKYTEESDMEITNIGRYRRLEQRIDDALKQYMEATGSAYSIKWDAVDGELHLGQVQYPDWRAKEYVLKALHSVEAKSRARSFASSSCPSSSEATLLTAVKKCWNSQSYVLCDGANKSSSNFARRELAAEFNIGRVLLVPAHDGVLELGQIVDAGDDSLDTVVCIDDVGATKIGTSLNAPGSLNAPNEAIELNSIKIDCTSLDPRNVKTTLDFLYEVFTPPKSIDAENGDGQDQLTPEQKSLEEKLGWNMLLSLLTIGEVLLVKENDLLEHHISLGSHVLVDVEECEAHLASMHTFADHVAEHIYVVLEGTFGTFAMDSGEERLLLKSPPGCLVGEDDVMLREPRSVILRCLTKVGRVVALTRKQVKCLQLGNSPLVGPEESECFIDYLQEEMARNTVTVEMALSDGR